MSTDKPYSLHSPFFAAVGGGGESLIERVEVNDLELSLLTKKLQTMSTQRVLAFFGQRQPVIAAVNQVLDENIDADDSLSKENCIYVAIKGEWVAIFAIIESQFFEKRVIDKESIVITLFRYLEDFSPTIVLCVADETIANFVSADVNPFSSVAHSARVYKLETQAHVELQARKLETNSGLLERDQDFNVRSLVLNENGSRFFLSQVQDKLLVDQQLEEIESNSTAVIDQLVQNCTLQSADVEALLRQYKLDSSAGFLRGVTNSYKKFGQDINAKCSHLTTRLYNDVYQPSSNEILKEKSTWKKIVTGAKSLLFSSNEHDQMKAAAGLVAHELLTRFLKKPDIQAAETEAYHLCVDSATSFFANKYDEADVSKISEIVKRKCPDHKLNSIFSFCEIQNRSKNLRESLSKIFTESIESQRRQPALQLNMYAINTQQRADGTCSGVIIAPRLSQLSIQSEQLLQHFQHNSKQPLSADEIMRRVTVTATFPLRTGSSFLMLLDYDKQCQALVAISSIGSHSVVNKWKIGGHYMLLPYALPASDSPANCFVLITTELVPTFTVFEVNESLKFVARKNGHINDIDGAINGSILSAATFPVQEKVLLLTNLGSLFELSLNCQKARDISASELKLRTNVGNTVTNKRLTATDGSNYTHVKSIPNKNFFVLHNNTVVDVYDWNLERLLSLDIQSNSSLKVFSDNKNVYLVAINQTNIVSFVFPELGADVTLRHQEEVPDEQVDGNPIIDVIYASYLKYGPNSQFIGAPAQNHYVLALQNEQKFNQKLQSYLKTFRRNMEVTTKTSIEIRETCEAQPANRHLPAIMSSRTPVQICTVEANNLLPLVDGNRMRVAADRATSIAEAAECMSFAHLERVVNEFCDDRSVRVVSIIGRQSSGKSYLLNQLFGTRFSVAATRCTDGIWMSYARIVTNDGSRSSDSQSFLVLDCEGLFSINRSEQEEVKMLMVLAAISDVTILNQDLNFNRYINKLFANLNNAIGKVSGSIYFHGLLMVAVRDVGSNESMKTAQEFERNVKTMNGRSEHQFLMRLFRGTMILHCLNHFESNLFAVESDKIRKSFVADLFERNRSKTATGHHADGHAILKSVKIVLLQVYNDDEQSADEHLKQIDQIRITNLVTSAWGEIGNLGVKAEARYKISFSTGQSVSAEAEESENQTFEIAQSNIQFEVPSNENESSFDKIKQALEEHFFQSTTDRYVKQGYNQRWAAFNAFLEEFVRQRAQLLQEYAEEQVQKLGRLLNDEETQNLLIGLQEKIRSFTIYHGLCLEKCALCYLNCLQRKGHKAALEPQKQQIQNQLKNVIQALCLEKRIKRDEMLQTLPETIKKLEQVQAKLQKSESKLSIIQERYQKAVELDEVSQTLAQLNTQLSEKRKALDSKFLKHSSPSSDTLRAFVENFLAVLSQIQIECYSIRNAAQKTGQEVVKSIGSRSNLDAIEQTLVKEIEMSDQMLAKTIVESDQSIAALDDNLRRFVGTNLASPSNQSDVDTMNKLNTFCDSLPVMIENARKIVQLGQDLSNAVIQRQKVAGSLQNQLQNSQLTSKSLQHESEGLMKNLSVVNESMRQKQLATTNAEAMLKDSQHCLETKVEEINQAQVKLSTWIASFTSLQQLEVDYCKVNAQLDSLSAELNAIKSNNPLLLSSAEVAQQVAEMMLEYLTLCNHAELQVSSSLPDNVSSVSAEWELVSVQDDVTQLGESSNKSQHSCTDTKSFVGVEYLKLVEKLSKLEKNENEVKRKIGELEVQITKFTNSESMLRAAGHDDDVVSTVLEKKEKLESEKLKMTNEQANLESSRNCIIVTDLYQRGKRITELHNQLSKDYSPHLNNEQLQRQVQRKVQLKSAIEGLNLKLKLQPTNPMNSAVSDTSEQMTDTQSPAQNPSTFDEAVRKNIGNMEAQLERTTEAILKLLWSEQVHEQVLKMQERQTELKQLQAQFELVLQEWRPFDENYSKLITEFVQLICLTATMQLTFSEELSSLNTLQAQHNYLQTELKLNLDQLTKAKNVQTVHRAIYQSLLWKMHFTEKRAQVQGESVPKVLKEIEKLLDSALSRRNQEEAMQLKSEIASLSLERNLFIQVKERLEILELDSVAALEKKRKKRELKSVALQVENGKLQQVLTNQREYVKLIIEQEELEKAISCLCNFTNHECDQQCSICPEEAQQKCKHKAGHDDPELLLRGLAGPKEHCCNKPKHDCPGKCHLCDNPCVYPLHHTNPADHYCSSSHQCERRCQYCTNRCQGNLAEQHSTHLCTEDKCPKRCILCGNACSGNHDHDETTTLVDVDLFYDGVPASLEDIVVKDPVDGKPKLKLHLCDKEHLCPKSCNKAGVCEIHYVSETREWTQLGSSQEYEYIKPERKTRRCAMRMSRGSAWHTEEHDCSKLHTCSNTCPECGSFCKEPIGHAGLHKTAVHRNMEHCYCVTKTRDEKMTVQDHSSGKKARVYQAGDMLTPEVCTQHCNRKGRAHYHLRPCPGGSKCGQKKHPIGVLHCDERFYPNVDKVYDKYLCAEFWESINWHQPSDNLVIHLCNFICPITQHKNESKEQKFCTGGAWHTSSHLAADHTFECGHDFTKPVFNGLDICFCIDTTGSMASYMKQTAQSIKEIMSGIVPQIATYGKDTSCLRFAVVGYKDHCDPDVVEHVDFCSDVKAINFLDSLKPNGGGDGPEAVLDGLNASWRLSWRADCEKLLIHICDAPPHGRQFTSMADDYPAGCPCSLNEVDVLKKLKVKSIKYYVIPLTSHVNQMIEVFSRYHTVENRELDDSVELSSLIPAIVSRAIQDTELTATDVDL